MSCPATVDAPMTGGSALPGAEPFARIALARMRAFGDRGGVGIEEHDLGTAGDVFTAVEI